jgi:Spy/CpxP family protein refolding chaperone
MKKNILVAAALIATLSTGAFAYNQGNCNGQGMQRGMMNQGMQKDMMNQGMYKRGGMRMFAQLNLTNEQRYQLSILRDEMKLEMKKARGFKQQNRPMQFVSADGFDKEAFKKFSNEKHAQRLELRANFMEKAFKILTAEQVAQLKTLAAK